MPKPHHVDTVPNEEKVLKHGAKEKKKAWTKATVKPPSGWSHSLFTSYEGYLNPDDESDSSKVSLDIYEKDGSYDPDALNRVIEVNVPRQRIDTKATTSDDFLETSVDGLPSTTRGDKKWDRGERNVKLILGKSFAKVHLVTPKGSSKPDDKEAEVAFLARIEWVNMQEDNPKYDLLFNYKDKAKEKRSGGDSSAGDLIKVSASDIKDIVSTDSAENGQRNFSTQTKLNLF